MDKDYEYVINNFQTDSLGGEENGNITFWDELDDCNQIADDLDKQRMNFLVSHGEREYNASKLIIGTWPKARSL